MREQLMYIEQGLPLISLALLLIALAHTAWQKPKCNKVYVTRNISLLNAISSDEFFKPGEIITPGDLKISTRLILPLRRYSGTISVL